MDILHGSVFRQVVGKLPAITFVIFLAGCSAADDGSSGATSAGTTSAGTSTESGSATSGGSLGDLEGVPDIDSFQLGPDILNPEAYNIFGKARPITAQFGDDLNSFVADGTEVHFMAEYGSIADSCFTSSSQCSVDWLSGAPRSLPFDDTDERFVGSTPCLNAAGIDGGLSAILVPCPYSNAVASSETVAGHYGGLGQVYTNRVSIMAWVSNGAETFFDGNGDGLFNEGEKFIDVGEPFIDHNEDGVFGGRLSDGSLAPGAASIGDPEGLCYDDASKYCFQQGGERESYVDINGNGSFDQNGNGIYNGPLCAVEGSGCTKAGVTIFKQFTILQSGSFPRIGVLNLDGAPLDPYSAASYPANMTIIGESSNYRVTVSDYMNGPMPEGTQIAFSTSYGEILGNSGCTVPNTSSLQFTECYVTVKADETSGAGLFTIKVTAPGGTVNEVSKVISD